MKLKLITKSNIFMVYSYSNPSNEFKQIYKKPVILAAKYKLTNPVRENLDYIPREIYSGLISGYLFIPEKMKKDIAKILPSTSNDIFKTSPIGLQQYFESDYSVILQCTPIKQVDPLIFGSIIAREDENVILEQDLNILLNKYIDELFDKIKTSKIKTEQWVTEIYNSIPVTNNGFVYNYPELITDESLKIKIKPKIEDFIIEYDIRSSSAETELEIIKKIETTFEDSEQIVKVHNTYNNILTEIIDKLNSKKLEFTKVSDDIISVRLDYLRMLDINYDLTDFL